MAPDLVGIKFTFYLSDVDGDSGALRVLPGSHLTPFSDAIAGVPLLDQEEPDDGLAVDELPATVLATRPGDAILFDFRIWHASWRGGLDRRMFSLMCECRPMPHTLSGQQPHSHFAGLADMKSPTSEPETAALEHHIEVAKTMTVGTAGKGGCAPPSSRSPAPALTLVLASSVQTLSSGCRIGPAPLLVHGGSASCASGAWSSDIEGACRDTRL